MNKQANKQARRAALRERLEDAQRDIYGNARTPWTDDVPGFTSFYDWLGDYAQREAAYMMGERFGTTERGTRPPRWYSAALRLAEARARFPVPAYPSQVRAEARNNHAFPCGEWERERAPLIRAGVENAWSYGRNGKTFYPQAFATENGRGFRLRDDVADGMNAEALTVAVLWLESFNAHVRSVAAAAPECYRSEAADALADDAAGALATIKANRATFATLARELRGLRHVQAPAACEVLRRRLAAIRADVRDAARELRETRGTLRALRVADGDA